MQVPRSTWLAYQRPILLLVSNYLGLSCDDKNARVKVPKRLLFPLRATASCEAAQSLMMAKAVDTFNLHNPPAYLSIQGDAS